MAGRVIAGRYRLERLIGRGGMGEVWSARHVDLEMRVALKMPLFPLTPAVVARFKLEAMATAELCSQNIVRVHDYGADGTVVYIAMELLEGETLRSRLSRGRRSTIGEALSIAKQTARALATLHKHGIVHRDIKPSNLFLANFDGEEILKVLDFGIALVAGHAPPRSGQRIEGSPSYLSPEQARGETVDHRTDVWSLGVVLFRALTGVDAFRAPTAAETMLKIRASIVPRVDELAPWLPREIDAFFARALSPRPGDRFESAEDLADAFEQVAAKSDVASGCHRAAEGPLSEPTPPSSQPTGREITASLEVVASHATAGAIIRVGNAPSHPREFNLTTGVCRVGAKRGADIVVEDETVSRAHVELALTPEGVAVRDLGSRNGTFYLGQRIERAVLKPGSCIHVGRAEIVIDPDGASLGSLEPLEQTHYGRLCGTSLAMRRLFAVLSRLEESLVNVFIEGESGTGKEVVARALHERSSVADGPFVAVNCGALDRALVRSELFGHRRGAFTSAVEGRLGAFELASGGTLFLDEIGELPVDIQPVLLRALESESVVRVGETAERPVKVRLVAATNRDLQVDVRERRFREDLYYRLMVVKLRIPALRERVEDIVVLAEHFATELGLGALAPELLNQLCTRPWPGNARELKNSLKAYAAIGALPASGRDGAGSLEVALRGAVDVTKPYAERKQEVVEMFRKVYVERLLEHTSGNQSQAARLSGLERSYLNKVVNTMGIRK